MMLCSRPGCDKELRPDQVYQFLRGKTKGTCSKQCGYPKHPLMKKTCVVCGSLFSCKLNCTTKKQMVCSMKCAGEMTSKRMTEKNPMAIEENVEKMRATLLDMGHKPYIQGGNGRGATVPQFMLYNELVKHDDSFEMEVIEKTGSLRHQFSAPNHYKIDIASRRKKIAIEVDGLSHSSKKIQECDQRKDQLLALRGWKVLRFTNSQIEEELTNCAQTVLSMI